MQQAMDEAAELNQPQFKVDIKNAPIQEETGDASTVMAGFASALQSVVSTSKCSDATDLTRASRIHRAEVWALSATDEIETQL